jgi:hypothetical protein
MRTALIAEIDAVQHQATATTERLGAPK